MVSLRRPNSGSTFLARFDHRPGRVIALCRAVLALAFFLALWIDPAQPVRATAAGYILLFGYLLAAAAMVPLAWGSWWWDHRLAVPAYAVDIAVFLAAIYFTEGANVDFNSPFLAFFAFLMLAATIRWDWRATALTGIAVSTLYLGVGLAMWAADVDFDPYRFGRRVTYMIVLSLVMVWFGIQRREPLVDRFRDELVPDEDSESGRPLSGAMAYAMAATSATAAVIAWSDNEEPWTIVDSAPGGSAGRRKLAPDTLALGQAAGPRLFDRRRDRALIVTPGGKIRAVEGPVEDPLAALAGFDEGLRVPFVTGDGEGELVLTGIAGACAEHLTLAGALSREIAAGFDRRAMSRLAREAAVARTRDAIARDLHDSVAQALAGAAFRLEALRSWIRAGKDPEPEIAAIKQALRSEQANVRQLISGLRTGAQASGESDLAATLATLTRELGEQWAADVHGTAPETLAVPSWMAHEVQQLAREGVANAVRHGRAGRIGIELWKSGGELGLAIEDNGSGLATSRSPTRPWSIYERVKSLGGTMTLASDRGGTRIDIVLPILSQP